MSNLSSALKNLVDATKTATKHMVTPFKASKFHPKDLNPVGLSFSHLDAETEAVTNLKEEEGGSWVNSILAWLMEVASALIKNASVQSHLIKAQQHEVNLKAEAEELLDTKQKLTCLELKVDGLERDCDEARQRGLKGNLIISSPNTANKPTVLRPLKVKDSVTKEERNENHLEVCIRAIQEKTGVLVPKEDVYACHPISKRGTETDIIFVICFSNRMTGSAWDSISSGLVSGKNSKGESFTSANLYISFQLTPKRAAMVKVARQSLGWRGGLARVRVDANGKVSVKTNSDTHNWTVVSNSNPEYLTNLIKAEAARARGGSPSHK